MVYHYRQLSDLNPVSSRSRVINQDGDCAPVLRVLLYLLALVGKASQAMLGEVLKDFGQMEIASA